MYGKCGPYFNHFIGMDNIHAQPASRSVWRQGCAQPTTATTVPGGMPQVLRYRKQFVNTDWGQRDERVIQGNPRNQVNPRNDTSKTFSSFPHYYIWYPERNWTPWRKPLRVSHILRSPFTQLRSITGIKTFYHHRYIPWFLSQVCKACAVPSSAQYTQTWWGFSWDRRGKGRVRPNQAKCLGWHLFIISKEIKKAFLARMIQVPGWCTQEFPHMCRAMGKRPGGLRV